MSSLMTYATINGKEIKIVVPQPLDGEGGQALNDNFINLADILSKEIYMSDGSGNDVDITPTLFRLDNSNGDHIVFGTSGFHVSSANPIDFISGPGTFFKVTNDSGVICLGPIDEYTGLTLNSADRVETIATTYYKVSAGDTGGGADYRAHLILDVDGSGVSNLYSLNGIGLYPANGVVTVNGSINFASGGISNVITNTASLTFGTIATLDEATADISVTGATDNDDVMLGPPVLPSGLEIVGYWATTDTVTIKVRNNTGSNLTPSAQTWRATVYKH